MSGETKVADVAAQIQQRIPINRSSAMRFYEWYHKTYFRTNSAKPILHLMLAVGTIGYAIEYPHIKHELEEAKKAASNVE